MYRGVIKLKKSIQEPHEVFHEKQSVKTQSKTARYLVNVKCTRLMKFKMAVGKYSL